MAEIVPFRLSASKPPTAKELVDKVRLLKAKDSENMHWQHPHFQERLSLRKVSMRQVLDVIDHGEPMGEPKPDQWGDWRVKLQRKSAGRRVSVVLAIKETHFVIVTVY